MIFVDATSSSKSPLNTGVQRVVRSLFAALARHAGVPVEPLIWNDLLGSYCVLSRREHRFLTDAFAEGRHASAKPERAANPWPWSKMTRHLGQRRRRIDLAARLREGDLLFVPEIFQDRRVALLTGLEGLAQGRRIAVFHDTIAYRRPELSPPGRARNFAAYLDSLATFDEVIAVSEFSSEDLAAVWRERGIKPRAQLSARSLCVERSEGRPLPGVSALSRRVLCVSTLEPRKNHLSLLAACESLWRAGVLFQLELIGRATPGHGERVAAEVARLRGAGHAVEWRLHVDDTTLMEAYAACRFTVFPSFIEGFGLPILESVWRGRPCVCANFGAMAEVAREGGCETTDVRDVDQLASSMRRLLDDDTRLDELARAAVARVFPTWDDYAQWLLGRV